MAHSSLSEEAQVIKLCDVCQEDHIKWRCIDCDMCLCGKCKTFHLRVPATAQHQIITIGTPLEDAKRKIVTNNIPCQLHETKVVCLFCETCDRLVCSECLSVDHQKHHFVAIETVLNEKLDKIKSLQINIADKFKMCKSKSNEVKILKPKYNAILDDSATKIKEREQELKDAISSYSKLLLDKVEDQRSKLNMILTKTDQENDQAEQELDRQRRNVENILTTNQGRVIFAADIKVPDIEFDPLPEVTEYFKPGEDTQQKLEELFGSLQRVPVLDKDFTLLQSFTTDLRGIHCLKVLDKSSICVSDFITKVIRKTKIQDNKLKVLKEIPFQAVDIALASNDDILLTDFNSSEVKVLTKSGEIKPFLSVAPLIPKGLHVTENNNVIVGVREIGDPYILTKKSQRAIIMFGMDGTQKFWYEYDKKGNRLFTVPFRIRTNYYQDILVVDALSDRNGRVVALDKDGHLKWVYKGHSQINATKEFDPAGMTTTSTGITIVSDCDNHALHVLSEDGDVLAIKVMDQMGIKYPWSLDIDREGNLWVGCFPENKTDQSELHVIKLFK